MPNPKKRHVDDRPSADGPGPNPPWTVVPGRREDATALAALLVSGAASRWDARAVLAEFDHRDARIWQAEAETLEGALFARWMVDALHVFNIAVRAESRRRGVATALLARAMRASAREGDGAVLLEVGARNGGAIDFYTARGFVVVGRRPRYYPDGEDAVLMTYTP